MKKEAKKAEQEELAKLEALEREADQLAEKTIADLQKTMDDTRDEAVKELERLQVRDSEGVGNQAQQLSRWM